MPAFSRTLPTTRLRLTQRLFRWGLFTQSCTRINSHCLLRFYMRSARSLKKSIRSPCGRRPTTRIWWTSRPPWRRRLALKGLGCMIILGPQEVSRAIAIVSPRTQIAGAFLKITPVFRGLRVKVRARVTSRPRWRSTTTPAPASETYVTSGGAGDDEGSDREEEAVAPMDNDSKEVAQLEEEPRSQSLCDDSTNLEPIPLLAGETGDVDMTK